MSLKNVTLLLAIMFLFGGITEVNNYLRVNSLFLFEDHPLAIARFFINGLMYLIGYLYFSRFTFERTIGSRTIGSGLEN